MSQINTLVVGVNGSGFDQPIVPTLGNTRESGIQSRAIFLPRRR
jgi:hypothetical protein